jgi:hypothetical protein
VRSVVWFVEREQFSVAGSQGVESIWLAPEVRNQVSDQRQTYAEQDAGREREKELQVAAAIRNVSGQAAEWNADAACEQNERAQQRDDYAGEQESAPQLRHLFIVVNNSREHRDRVIQLGCLAIGDRGRCVH